MKRFVLLVAVLSILGCTQLRAQSNVCPTNAVFLALQDEVRGYSTRANGLTAPCQVVQGDQTTFSTANALSISTHGNLHVSQFLTNGSVLVFLPSSSGNCAPERIENSLTNDLLSVATDSKVNDYILSRREGPSTIIVVPPAATIPSYSFSDPNLITASDIAIDPQDNLLIAGYDMNGNPVVDTYGTSSSLSSPSPLRTLGGSATGLLAGDPSSSLTNDLSVSVDPVSQEIYVYSYSPTTGQRQVSVFPAGANGNVKPSRVISGNFTQVGPPGELVNKISVSADGRLFDAEANNRILVFAPGASGNVPPSQIIQDSTLGTTQVAQGGIAVRSCHCQ